MIMNNLGFTSLERYLAKRIDQFWFDAELDKLPDEKKEIVWQKLMDLLQLVVITDDET
jgi:hypothetical protein